MPSFRELLDETKAADPRGRHRRGGGHPRRAGTVVLDVREPDEYEQGAIPGALYIPRGQLESADREPHPRQGRADRHPLRLRGPLGVRGQDADRARLHRRRLDGRRLQQVEGRGPRLGGPRDTSPPSSATATSATCSCPRSATRPAKLLDSEGAAPRRRWPRLAGGARTSPPPASARSASSTWTSSTTRTSSARSSTTSTGSASARSTRPRRRSRCSTPTSTSSPTTSASTPTT